MSPLEDARSENGSNHRSHPYHASTRDWPETNCYTDLWIEVLHAADLPVEPLLPFTIAADFEGDQWTFFKPPHADLSTLYGIEVEELSLWRSLESHCQTQVDRDRIVLVEMDAFYLPDTMGRDYRKSHTKTTIGIEQIRPDTETLSYFHNRSKFELRGEDYRGLFRDHVGDDDPRLPPYCEIAKMDRVSDRTPEELRARSIQLLRRHRVRCPGTNPVIRWAEDVGHDLEWLIAGNVDLYDPYLFAGIRQCGAGYSLSADYFRWLGREDHRWAAVAEPFARISSIASKLILKIARIVHSGRMRDLTPDCSEMAMAWEQAFEAIDRGLAE